MKQFMEMNLDERRTIMHNAIDNTFCALMFFYDDYGEIQTFATVNPGYESNILELFATAATKANIFVEDNIKIKTQ